MRGLNGKRLFVFCSAAACIDERSEENVQISH